MNEAVKDALIKVRKNPKSPYIFCYRNGEQVRYSQIIRKSFWTALRKSGIKDFHFHMWTLELKTKKEQKFEISQHIGNTVLTSSGT